MPMESAIIGAVSALVVLIAGKLLDHLAYKRKRKDTLADKQADKEKAKESEVLSAINELKDEISEVKEDVGNLRTDVEKVRSEAEEGRVVERRIRILHFADEITHQSPKHSRDHFQQLMDDCKYYEDYVDAHPDFKNGLTDPAIKLIRETYEDRLRKNDFL